MNVILDLQQYQQTAYNLKELPEVWISCLFFIP